ncbi:hypothetical protein ABH897_003484 [Paenibacillus sp. RC73]|uniref:hypothetical protein n=1 Tax=Paenibacillus sp. RC73 TaxID=3156250 RepID=UPI003834A38D
MRELNADLAICGAATEGATMCIGDSEVFCEYIDDRLPDGLIGRFARTEDALFFTEAREGWPEAIRRAIATEGLLHGLVDAINRGDLRQVRMSSGTDYAIGSAKRYLSR